jgi:hypothetical protein
MKLPFEVLEGRNLRVHLLDSQLVRLVLYGIFLIVSVARESYDHMSS